MHSEEIQSPLVRGNLSVICQAIKDLDIGPEREAAIDFFCDLKTGEIFYTPSTIPSHEMTILVLSLDMGRQEVSWKTKEGEKLLAKAEEHLEEMAVILKGVFPKVEKLAQLARVHWQAPFEENRGVHDPVFKQAWHAINREETERRLLSQQIGTFLFRKDHFALVLQEILRRALKKSIHCYTLSYLDDERIVRDKTVVLTDQQWTFYDDDPTLSGPSSASLRELICSVAKHPLLSRLVFRD
jgi:hypothetical protein